MGDLTNEERKKLLRDVLENKVCIYKKRLEKYSAKVEKLNKLIAKNEQKLSKM